MALATCRPPVAGESLNRPDESKLSSVRFLLSPLVVLCTPWRPAALSAATGAGGQGHSQLKTSNFYGYNTGSLFLSLHAPRYCLSASAGFGRQFTKLRALSRLRRRYGSKKESFPRPLRPPPPHEKAPSPSAGGGAIFKQKSSFIQPARRCPGFPGAHCSADRPKPRRSTARCSSHRSGAGRHS